MEKLITKEKTNVPIGRSGFYFAENAEIDDLSVRSVKKVPCARSLYEVRLHGLRFKSSDETGAEHASAWDIIIFDSDDQELHEGYVMRMNKNLFAIFDSPSTDIGWPAPDSVIIKNSSEIEKNQLFPLAPIDDGKITKVANLFMFEGELWDNCPPSRWNQWNKMEKKKHWRAFVNSEGKTVYDGWCWDYCFENNILKIKRGKTSKKFITIPL